MSEHPNVTTVNRLTGAVFDQDREALARLLADDFELHVRGPFPKAGDHAGVDGLLGVVGWVVEKTGGDVQLDQLFCVGTDGWAAEWEHAVLGRDGRKLESNNSFVYRFDGDRIAEMWMLIGAPAGAEAFFA